MNHTCNGDLFRVKVGGAVYWRCLMDSTIIKMSRRVPKGERCPCCDRPMHVYPPGATVLETKRVLMVRIPEAHDEWFMVPT